jgi:hypothetical protein
MNCSVFWDIMPCSAGLLGRFLNLTKHTLVQNTAPVSQYHDTGRVLPCSLYFHQIQTRLSGVLTGIRAGNYFKTEGGVAIFYMTKGQSCAKESYVNGPPNYRSSRLLPPKLLCSSPYQFVLYYYHLLQWLVGWLCLLLPLGA